MKVKVSRNEKVIDLETKKHAAQRIGARVPFATDVLEQVPTQTSMKQYIVHTPWVQKYTESLSGCNNKKIDLRVEQTGRIKMILQILGIL